MNCFQIQQSSLFSSQVSSQILNQSSSYILQSKVSQYEMEQMSMDNLLSKLLELYQTLQTTQKDNQLLRIQKAQLRNQLQDCKDKAQQFLIQSKQRCSINKNLQMQGQRHTFNKKNYDYQFQQKQSEESTRNCFVTPNLSQSQFQNSNQQLKDPNSFENIQQKTNKVFVKTHRRGISNNCIKSKGQIIVNNKKNYNSSLNSPKRSHSSNFQKNYKYSNNRSQSIKIQQNCYQPQTNNGYKLEFPQDKLNSLIIMQRQYEETNHMNNNRKQDDQTLQNFDSFYYNRNSTIETTRKQDFICSSLSKNNYNLGNSKQTFKKTIKTSPYSVQGRLNTEVTQKDLGQSFNYDFSKNTYNNANKDSKIGFKIPSSIDQLWQSSKPTINFTNILNNRNQQEQKSSKLCKMNISKMNNASVNFQKKSYLNQQKSSQFGYA